MGIDSIASTRAGPSWLDNVTALGILGDVSLWPEYMQYESPVNSKKMVYTAIIDY